MLHSTYAHKETNEDPKTSAIFENLLLLPENICWAILREACSEGSELPVVSGRLLEYEFWPHWNPEGTRNQSFVEPDLFLRFQQFDVVIEAKYGDSAGQDKEQWEREVTSYYNEYEDDAKTLVFIAVGGNTSKCKESVNGKGHKVDVYRCTWESILLAVSHYEENLRRLALCDYSVEAQKRTVANIILAFNINGIYNMEWFGSLWKNHYNLSQSSITSLYNYFNYGK